MKPVHPDDLKFKVSPELYQKQLKSYERYHAIKAASEKIEASKPVNTHKQFLEIPAFPRDSVARKLVQQLEDGING